MSNKSKKRKLYTSIICSIMATVTILMGISALAAGNEYKTSGVTSFRGRAWLGDAEKGKFFEANLDEATLTFKVKGEPDATRATCYVYQLKKEGGDYYVVDKQSFKRPIGSKCKVENSVTLTFEQEVASKYKYVFSVKELPQKGNKITEWPDVEEKENRVVYSFIIKKGMKLVY